MENKFFSSKGNQILASLALFMVILALGMYAKFTWKQIEYVGQGPVTISVSGEGEVTAVPDVGEFSFSVESEGKTASVAQSDSATKINAILAFLKEKGIAEKDIKTQNYNLYPKYRYEQRPCPMGSYCPGQQVADGFTVTQTVQVKVRAVDTAGELISGVGDKGATNLSSLSFTIDDTTTLKDEARTEAIADAKAKAEVLAKQLGVRLGKMIGYYENEGGAGPQPYYASMSDMALESAKAAVAPELPRGDNKIVSNVTITYQIR